MINDTFTLYAEQSLEVVNKFSMRLYEPLAGGEGKSLVEAMAGADDMSAIIADNMTQYVVEQITQHRDALIAEQAFRYESILSPHLCKLGQVHKLALVQKITELLTLIQSPNPVEDAAIMLSVLDRIEYEGLLVEPEDLNRDAIRSMLLRQLDLMLNSRVRA